MSYISLQIADSPLWDILYSSDYVFLAIWRSKSKNIRDIVYALRPILF